MRPARAEEIYFRILSVEGGDLLVRNLRDERPMAQAAGLIRLARARALHRRLLRVAARLTGQKGMGRIIPYFDGGGDAYLDHWARERQRYVDDYLSAMDRSPAGPLDAVLSPVCALPAYLHGSSTSLGLGGAYTLQHNLTGFPAGVATLRRICPHEAVPRRKTVDLQVRTAARVEASAEGLPLAVQVAGRPWKEHVVLKLLDLLHRQV